MLIDHDPYNSKTDDILLQSEKDRRKAEIERIQKDVDEIADMFAIIGEMVDEQGDSLDVAEDNTASAEYHIEKAEIEINIAMKRKIFGDKIKYGGLGLLSLVASIPLGIYAGGVAAGCTVLIGTGLGGYAMIRK